MRASQRAPRDPQGISAKRSCCRCRGRTSSPPSWPSRHPWPKCRMGRRRRHKRAHRLPQRWRPGLQVPGRMRDASYEHLLQNCRADGAKTPAIFNLTPPVPNQAFIRPFYGSSAGGPHTLMTHPLGPAHASPHLPGSRRRPYPRRYRPKSARAGRLEHATACPVPPICAPVAAKGWPKAMLEPLTLSFDRSIAPSARSRPSRVRQYSSDSHAFSVASTCAAKAS